MKSAFSFFFVLESVHYLSMKEQDNQKDIHNSEMQEAGGDQSDHLEIPSQSKDDTVGYFYKFIRFLDILLQ